jgi:hypothetical protein
MHPCGGRSCQACQACQACQRALLLAQVRKGLWATCFSRPIDDRAASAAKLPKHRRNPASLPTQCPSIAPSCLPAFCPAPFWPPAADAMESFVSSVIASGFGANDESTERDVLAKLMADRPLPPASLLSAGGDAARLLALAALSDSLDYVADVIQRCTSSSSSSGASAATAASSAAAPGSLAASTAGAAAAARADSWQARLMSWAGRGPGLEKGLTEGLAHLVDR